MNHKNGVFDNLKLSHFSTVRSHKSPFPTYKLVKGDPVLQAAFEKELEFIKKLIMEEIVLLHVDETHVRAYQALRTYDTGRSRQSKTSPGYGHHAHVSIFGAVDVQPGDVVSHRAS